MAYLPGHAPTSLGYTPPKKKKPKPPKPVGSYDPYGATDQAAADLAELIARGPDYSQIPAPRSDDVLNKIASERASVAFQPYEDWTQEQRDILDRKKTNSQEAAQAFTLALAGLFTGGKTGDEGMAYAKEHYGGSYMGAIAAEMGKDLWREVGHDFEEQDAKLVNDLADIMAKKPEYVAETIAGLMKQDEESGQQMMKLADKSWDYRVKAGGVILNRLRDKEKDAIAAAKDGGGKAGGAGGSERQVVYVNGVPYLVDPVTGKSEPAVAGAGTAKGAKSASAKAAASDGTKSERIYGNSETGYYYIRNGKKVPIAGTGTAAAGTPGGGASSSKSTSTTVARATEAGKDALETVLANIAVKFPAPDPKTDPEGFERAKAAYQAWIDSGKSFRSAITRVTVAIGPHLKDIGYTPSQIKRAAYDIVSAEMKPPKGYKPPKDKAARVAANKLPSPTAIDFNWLSSATTGKTGWTDLGGPSAHYAKHDTGENWQSNNAWDISLPIGTPLYATTDGVIGSDVGVQSTRPNDGSRLTLNGSGNSFWYGHLSKVAVKPGQRVKAGQLLGYSGASQNGAAHLHIGVMNIGGNYS